MQGKLTALKNIIWSVCILICLVALLVGFLFAAFTKYDGSGKIEEPVSAPSSPVDENPGAGETGGAQPSPAAANGLMELEETDNGGQSYIDTLTFLCDSALVGLRDYGILAGGAATSQVWGSEAGNIPASSLGDFTIKFPGDGSSITPADAAMVSLPKTLIISLGTDGLADVSQEDFVSGYTALINSIRGASPGTALVCCSMTAVTVTYDGSDGLSTSLVSTANGWLRQICEDTGVYYLNLADAVCDSSGMLMAEYAAANGKTLNTAGLTEALAYISTHMVP